MVNKVRTVKTLCVLLGAGCLIVGRWLEGEPQRPTTQPQPELAP